MKTTILACLSLSVFAQKKEKNKPLLRHVVLFSFKSTSSSEDVKSVEEAFHNLYGKVPQIKDFEWGTNMSPESSRPKPAARLGLSAARRLRA